MFELAGRNLAAIKAFMVKTPARRSLNHWWYSKSKEVLDAPAGARPKNWIAIFETNKLMLAKLYAEQHFSFSSLQDMNTWLISIGSQRSRVLYIHVNSPLAFRGFCGACGRCKIFVCSS